MTATDIMNSEDFKRCEAFHGHVCPGLSIGFQAARTAMDRLRENRSADEEVVAIVETDACSADAIQVLTGCTFGKGNFIYKDHGKMVLTLLSRSTGKGVRVALRPDGFQLDEDHMALLRKIMAGEATAEERSQFGDIHRKPACHILETPVETLFNITSVEMTLPKKAQIEPSSLCAVCGEPTMPSKMETSNGQRVCRGCLR